ncbi:hypothetical protein PBT90_16890 [Algoriphagus halophytocola]|uniref:Lipoprotein n=1 Tax=Algoriphagus halophytocola TaxID=2991499 RepID=A0ABY6MG92_9BACT|nr:MULTISPECIES: hypothetical protein [unclassified Algoriphagus]UZD21204.1 hypothetical protein OM944_11025 [Algoriphagus sp. TR-M5]WBL42414.1 hypothetical protein PBT90_16890 [Algoriphagus sp. TR-M9]
MKKVFAIFAMASMFVASSCGNKEVKEEEVQTIEVVEEPAVEEVIIEETPADTAVVVVEEVVEEVQ